VTISRGDQFPKREGRGIAIQGDEQGLLQRDLDKVYRHLQKIGANLILTTVTIGGVSITGIVTTVADPGLDTKIPTEQAVREAINQGHGWGLLWAWFLGAG
jgi:hypothetical protein